jgi:hypothetical protein
LRSHCVSSDLTVFIIISLLIVISFNIQIKTKNLRNKAKSKMTLFLQAVALILSVLFFFVGGESPIKNGAFVLCVFVA